MEEGSFPCVETSLIWGIVWDDPVHVVKLEVPEAELGGTSMGLRVYVLAEAYAEEEGDLDEISCALIFGGGGSGGTNINDEAKGWGGVPFLVLMGGQCRSNTGAYRRDACRYPC